MDTRSGTKPVQNPLADLFVQLREAVGEWKAGAPLPVGSDLHFVFKKLKDSDLIDQSITKRMDVNVPRSKAKSSPQALRTRRRSARSRRLPTSNERHLSLKGLQRPD